MRYSPFYWEDVDLSWRAMEHGWHTLFDPHILVEHHHESTIGALFQREQILEIAYQHQLLFTRTHARGWQRVHHEVGRWMRWIKNAMR